MTAVMEIRQAVETQEGEGVKIKRLMPAPGWSHYDPFVLCDHFTIAPGAGLPDHPHRGFEAITYLFAGALRHEDSLGNRSTVLAGGLQRFTAGRGLVHSEMPIGEGVARGIQLWIKLPARLKDMEPGYQQLDRPDIPVRSILGGEIAVLAGEESPLALKTPIRYLDARLEPGTRYRERPPAGYRGFIYAVQGSAAVSGRELDLGSACFIEQAEEILIEAWEVCRLMICFGRPHGEPIRQLGPYVD